MTCSTCADATLRGRHVTRSTCRPRLTPHLLDARRRVLREPPGWLRRGAQGAS
ncbi:hypothetical protein T492DRAFT_1082686 [Pavlovales sp. CCMP2436]|nr:hypothetical protein T492DRAFT_1082686 [Pavlovales sp. CCMP2436]